MKHKQAFAIICLLIDSSSSLKISPPTGIHLPAAAIPSPAAPPQKTTQITALAEVEKHHHSQTQTDIRQENKLLNDYLKHNNKSHQDKKVASILKQIQKQNNTNEKRVESAIRKERDMKEANDKVIVKLMEDAKDGREEKKEDAKEEKKDAKKEEKKEEKTDGKKEEKKDEEKKAEPKKEEAKAAEEKKEAEDEAKAPAKEETSIDKAVKQVLKKDEEKDNLMKKVKKIMKDSKPKQDESDRYETDTKQIIAKGLKAKRDRLKKVKASILDKYGGNEFDREVDNEAKGQVSYSKEEVEARDSELDGEALTREIGGKLLASEIQSSINGAGFSSSRIVSDVNDILTNVRDSQEYFQKSSTQNF